MLKKLTVSNFKSFERDFVFDLSDVNGYEFNRDCIKNGLVNNALVYGHNGVGKSNLGLAIFDLVGHLTDFTTAEFSYKDYLNALNGEPLAHFIYEFIFNGYEVVYEYKKSSVRTTLFENFMVNGKELAFIDRNISNQARIKFKGAETLNNELTNTGLALLKYIKNNSQLEDNDENKVFFEFYQFVNSMLFFRSLQENVYIGLENGDGGIQEDIISKGNVKDLEKFLNKAGIECRLNLRVEFDREEIVFDFNGKTIPFYQIASSGTQALSLFYYWLQRIREQSKVQFVFIDEFDAFYHHELSALIVEELKKTGIQFILTSHNTSIITNDLLRPDCYFLMTKDRIRSLSRSTPKELREAHNIEKMYKAGSFDVG